MRRLPLLSSLFALSHAVCVSPGTSLAGGWDNGIMGPRASGMGTAFTGLADDPSAIFYNPGGLALLEDEQGVAVTLRFNTTDLKYEFPSGRSSPAGAEEATSNLIGLLPDIFYYRRFDNFAAGIGVYIPYGGLAGSWTKDTFGMDLDQFMAVASVTPTLAWAITPRLSVGAGLNVYLGYMQSKVDSDRIPLGQFLPDAAASLPDTPLGNFLRYPPLRLKQELRAFGPAFGFSAGILYKPEGRLSFGLAVRSGADVTLNGSSRISIGSEGDPISLSLDPDVEIKYKLPYLVVAGFAFRPTSSLVLLLDIQYNGWGRLEDLRLTFENIKIGSSSSSFTQVSETGYRDTVKFMLGMEYVFEKRISVRLGYMYSPSNLGDDEFLSYQSWDTNIHNFAVGFGYAWRGFSVHAYSMISPGEWNEKEFDDPGDPIGKPAGNYGILNQAYGIGWLWAF